MAETMPSRNSKPLETIVAISPTSLTSRISSLLWRKKKKGKRIVTAMIAVVSPRI